MLSELSLTMSVRWSSIRTIPSCSWTFLTIAVFLGRAKQAIDLMSDAIRLHPDHPDVYLWVLAFAIFTEGQYEKTLAWLQRMTEPGDSRRLLAATYAKLGRLEEARAAAEEFLKEWPHFSISRWAEYEPYQNPADLENYVDGLRKAGLPE